MTPKAAELLLAVWADPGQIFAPFRAQICSKSDPQRLISWACLPLNSTTPPLPSPRSFFTDHILKRLEQHLQLSQGGCSAPHSVTQSSSVATGGTFCSQMSFIAQTWARCWNTQPWFLLTWCFPFPACYLCDLGEALVNTWMFSCLCGALLPLLPKAQGWQLPKGVENQPVVNKTRSVRDHE